MRSGGTTKPRAVGGEGSSQGRAKEGKVKSSRESLLRGWRGGRLAGFEMGDGGLCAMPSAAEFKGPGEWA